MKNLFLLLPFLLLGWKTFTQTEPRLVLPVGHTESLSSAVFSPDGKLALTASRDKTARIYEVSTGKELQVLSGHTEGINSAVFSPNGKLALTASYDNTARIYEVSTGKELSVLSGHTDIVSIAVFSPDGNLALTASSDKTARIYEVSTGKELEVLNGHTLGIKFAVFSPDGKLALTASRDKTARIYEVSSGKELQVLSGHTYSVNSAVFSPDGKLALTASSDKTARIYEVSSGKELQVLSGHTYSVNSAVFSPDGKLALTAGDTTARIYEVSTGKELQVLSGHTSYVRSAVFSPDGKLALTASYDNTSRIYEVSSGKELQVLSGHTRGINSAVFSPDGKLALTASIDNTARIYEVSTGKEVQVLSGHTYSVNSAVFSPDGKLALTASDDYTARIYEVSIGKELQELSGHKKNVRSAVFSPDGKLALTASDDYTARIYEVSTGKELQELSGHKKNVRSAVFSPDGKLALTASDDNTARLYEVSTGKELQVLSGHTSIISSAVFSTDGKLALTAGDTTASIYEVSTGKELSVLSGHTSIVSSAVFSPDGKLALTASSDNTARIYEVSTGKELQVLSGHTDFVTSAVFSPDGKLALTASNDKTARLWEVSSGKELQVLSGHTGVINSAVFSPDGKLALTASDDNTARIYEVSTGNVLQVLIGHTDWVTSAVFSPDGKRVLTTSIDHKTILWNVETGKPLYTRLQLENNDWLVYDEEYHFDGTPGAIEKLYFVCGLEVIELSQVKQSLRVRGLAEKILNKEDLSGYDNIRDLNICGKLPLIEQDPIKGKYAFRIEKREAELVRIEVYLGKKRIKVIDPKNLKWQNNKTILVLDSKEIESFFNPGEENTVKVQAVALIKSKDYKEVEVPDRGVVVRIEDNRERKTPKVFGLFVGVNEYNDPKLSLNFPGNDALSMAETIQYGTEAFLGSERVKFYTIHSNFQKEKENGYGTPTRNTIKKALQEIAQEAEPQDVLFLFFAGHGTMGEGTTKKFTFLTSEATSENSVGITTDTLFSWIGTEGPFGLKANKAILILDACNSAQLLNDLSMRSLDEDERQKQLDQLSDRSGMFILSAAAPNKSAYEYPKLEHGLLTYSLLRVLKLNSEIYEKDDYVNMTKWFYQASRDLEKLTEELGLKQEATASGTSDFQLLKLNSKLKDNIQLAEEKQQLFFEGAENSKTESSDRELINRLVRKTAENESFKKCFYVNKIYSNEALVINIKYSQKGSKITCRILVSQNNKKVTELILKNNKADWSALEKDILDAITAYQCP